MKKVLLFILNLICLVLLVSCKNSNDSKVLDVAFPAGAPALAQCEISYNVKNNGETRFKSNLLNGTTDLKAGFINQSYDLIYAPINLGAQTYNSNQSYKLLCGVTFGNLYFGSKEELNSISDLSNKDIVLFSKGTINDLIATYVLDSNNVTPKSITYVDSAATTKTDFVADTENKVYLLADPTKSAASVALGSKGISTYFIDIEDEYQKLLGSSIKGFAQAGLFVKSTTYDTNKDLVLEYVELLKDSIFDINNKDRISTTNIMVKDLGYFDLADSVLLSGIKGSNINYIKGSSMKELVEETYSLNKTLLGGTFPDEEFYID